METLDSALSNNRVKLTSSGGALPAIAIWKKVRITATGAVAGIAAGNIFGGIVTQAVGTATTITAYDAASAVAADLIIPVTNTTTTNLAGALSGPIGSGVNPLTAVPYLNAGILLTTGLWVVIGGTGSPTFWVLYR